MDLLVKDAELISYAVTDRRHVQRREGVHITCGQPAEAAVAEARFFLLLKQVVQIKTEFFHRRPHLLSNAQIQEIVSQVRPHQELCGEVAGELDLWI